VSIALDRLVAEKCCEWTVNMERAPYKWSVPLRSPYYAVWEGQPVEWGVPAFTGSIGEAWRVREELQDAGMSMGISDHLGQWECVFLIDGETFCAKHESAPMAICLAALRAVGVDEAQIKEACK
jgi:hypothetical protein